MIFLDILIGFGIAVLIFATGLAFFKGYQDYTHFDKQIGVVELVLGVFLVIILGLIVEAMLFGVS